MNRNLVFMAAGLCGWMATLGCQQKERLPWRLLELGTQPLAEAMEHGNVVHATYEGQQDPFQGLLFPRDTTLQARIARRDVLTLPTLACGDRMRLHPADLPGSLTKVLDWTQDDSLTVRWNCLGEAQVAALGMQAFALGGDSSETERKWLEVLRSWKPETKIGAERRYGDNDPVSLTVVCTRPDGRQVGDTVRLKFRKGETDQVVPALEKGLAQAGPGASWSVWCASEEAFGSQAHPSLGLAAHMPLHFTVQAD